MTTNVTGHAALLALNVASADLCSARMVALWLILFLAGAFASGILISLVGRDKAAAYTVPILITLGGLSGIKVWIVMPISDLKAVLNKLHILFSIT